MSSVISPAVSSGNNSRWIGRTAIYGSFFNFYMCNMVVNIPLGTTPGSKALSMTYNTIAPRCSLS